MDVEEMVALSVKHNVSDLHPAGAGQDALNPRRFRRLMSGRY